MRTETKEVKVQHVGGNLEKNEIDDEGYTEVMGKKRRRSRKRAARRAQTISTSAPERLQVSRTIEPEGVYAVSPDNEWEVIELAVGSAATETVVSEDMLNMVETKEGPIQPARSGVRGGQRGEDPELGGKEVYGSQRRGHDTEYSSTGMRCDQSFVERKEGDGGRQQSRLRPRRILR